MSTKEERVWAGSDASLQVALEAETKITAGSFKEEDDQEGPRLLSVADGLATITIKGPLVNSDSPYLKYFGVVGYSEIRDALIAAVSDQNISQILLDIDSGGGAVSGCGDTGSLIRSVHKIKPVTAFGDTMASAAYWLACSAGRVYSGKAALVGSIGVKATFREYSKMNEMEGIKVTVIRAGKYKALADQNEPLSKAAEAQIQAMVDAAYGVFVDHVSEMRGKTWEYTDKTMADGQEFIGQAAVDVGLTDGVTTFDAVVGGLKKKILATLSKSKDNGNVNRFSISGSVPTQTGDSPMAKKALTEADIAALASGIPLESTSTTQTTQEGAGDGLQTQQEDAHKAEVAAEVEAKSESATTDSTVQFLQSQIVAKDEALLAAGIKLAKLEEQLAEAQASHAPLLEIAVKSVKNMSVALNGASLVAEGASAAQVLAEHSRVTALFQSKYPVGGVAAVADATDATQTQIDPRRTARVNAVRFQK